MSATPLPLHKEDTAKAGRKRKADTLIGKAIDTDSKLLKLLDSDMLDVYNMAKAILHDPNSRPSEKLKAGQIMKAWRDDVYKKAMESKETLDSIQPEEQPQAKQQPVTIPLNNRFKSEEEREAAFNKAMELVKDLNGK